MAWISGGKRISLHKIKIDGNYKVNLRNFARPQGSNKANMLIWQSSQIYRKYF